MRPTKPLQEQAYEAIREQILSHKLEHGVVYSETQLARQIGVSRTPVRDALQHLSQEGYLEILPSKGFVLHRLTKEDLQETYHVRCAMEGYCIRMLAGEINTPAGIQALEQLDSLVAEQRHIVQSTGDFAAFVEWDQQFHNAIVSYAQSEQLRGLFASHMHRIYRFALDSFEQPGRMEDALAEHERIVDAVRSGWANAAYAAVLRHMDALKTIALERL